MVGTLRTVLVVSGRPVPAGAAAFIESTLWVTAVGVVLVDLSWERALAFAAGVGIGTALGVAATGRLRLGLATVRVFVPCGPGREHAGQNAAEAIRALGAPATVFDGEGRDGHVRMILSVVRRRDADIIVKEIRQLDSAAFATIDNAPAPGSAIPGVPGR